MSAITLPADHFQREKFVAISRLARTALTVRSPARAATGVANRFVTSAPTDIPPAGDWLGEIATKPSEVRDFCEKHRIMSPTVSAVKMAERHFSKARKISLAVENDPEGEAEWLALDVVTSDNSANALRCYDAFIREWAATPNAQARQLIRLTFCRL
jgi:hypothetical protein